VDGGLGVRRLGVFDLALLGKWCWRLLIDKEGLWYKVLKARYSEVGGRLQEGGRHGSSWWKTLCQIRSGVGVVNRNQQLTFSWSTTLPTTCGFMCNNG